MTSRTLATSRVAIAWAVLRALPRMFEPLVRNAVDIFEATHISLTTNRVLNRNVPCANERDVVRRMDGPGRTEVTNVTSGSARTVRRTKK